MVDRRPSIASLRRQIAKQKAKVSKLDERADLQRQLNQLKSAGRTDVRARIGRGFRRLSRGAGKVVLKQAKVAGRATLKQAQLIRDRQIREAKATRKKRRGGGLTGTDSIFAPLDF